MDDILHGGKGLARDSGADILLVEDNLEDAELTLRALEQCGLAGRAAHVSDGEEALDYVAGDGAYVRSHAAMPKLILLDLGLKKIGGLHVARRLKSDERTKAIPIVVLTSSMAAIELGESYKTGINSYVIKPTDSQKFAEIVSSIANYWLNVNKLPP
jgi:two-component system response regulator